MLPALVFEDTNSMFLGYQVAFGYQFMSLGPWANGSLEFSLINLIAYALPAAAATYLIFRKDGYYIAAFSFLISAILLSLIPFFTTIEVTVLGNPTSVNIDWGFGLGLTVAILFSIFAFMVSLYIISYRMIRSKTINA